MSKLEELKKKIADLDAQKEELAKQVEELESGVFYTDCNTVFKKITIYKKTDEGNETNGCVYEVYERSNDEEKLLFADKDVLVVLKWLKDMKASFGEIIDCVNRDVITDNHSLDGELAKELIYDGYSSRDCASFYRCPVCNRTYNSYQFDRQRVFRCSCGALLSTPK